MSISPLHGGLVFLEDQQNSSKKSGPQQQEEEEKIATSSLSTMDLNTRDINEFFNPRVSDLSLDERVELCL